MYNRKKTFMSISFSINTQRTTQNHEFESTLSINPNIYTWVFLHRSLRALNLLPASIPIIFLQCIMSVSISCFPLVL